MSANVQDANPFDYPGVSWDRIGTYVTYCVVAVAFLAVAAGLNDFFTAREVASRRPRQLRSYGAKRWRREEVRALLARSVHPTRTALGRTLEGLDFWFSCMMVCIYWQSTYLSHPPTLIWSAVVLTLNLYFAMHWFLRLITHSTGQRISYVLSLRSVVNICSVVCAVMTATGAVETYMTLAYLRVFSAFWTFNRLLRFRASRHRCSRVQFVGYLVILHIASFIITMAGTIATIERAGDLPGSSLVVTDKWASENALYFSVVTVATVGYGDISPSTALGRLLVCVFIITGAVTFSRVAAALIEVYQEPHAGLGFISNSSGRMLVLLTGSPNRRQLCDVLDELFHPAHPNAAFLHVVSLLEGQFFSEEDARWFGEHPDYGSKLSYLRGSVFSPRDLQRAVPGAMIAKADSERQRLQAVFVLSAFGTEEEDTQNQLRAMALRRSLPPGTEIYVLLGGGDSQHSLQALGIPPGRILARDVVKSGFFAANTATPGVGTLLVNLFSSDGGTDAGVERQLEPPRQLQRGVLDRLWSHSAVTSAGLNPEWLAQRITWRSDRLRRCFPAFADDAMVQQLADLNPVPQHVHVTMSDEARSSDARTGMHRPRWWDPFVTARVPTRPAWHADYEDGLEQELFQLAMPAFLYDTTLLESTVILYATPLAALLCLPLGDPERIAPPKSWEELMFTLAAHPALRYQQGPILVGTPATVKGPPGGAPVDRIFCNLNKKYTMRREGGSVLVLLRDRRVLPRIELINNCGLRALVLGLLWEYALRCNIELPGRPRAVLEARLAREAIGGSRFGEIGNGDSFVRSVARRTASTFGPKHSSLRSAPRIDIGAAIVPLAQTLASTHGLGEKRAKLPPTWARLAPVPGSPTPTPGPASQGRDSSALSAVSPPVNDQLKSSATHGPAAPHQDLHVNIPKERSGLALGKLHAVAKAAAILNEWPAMGHAGAPTPALAPAPQPPPFAFPQSPGGASMPSLARRSSLPVATSQFSRAPELNSSPSGVRRSSVAVPSIPAFPPNAGVESAPQPTLISGRPSRGTGGPQKKGGIAACSVPALTSRRLQQRRQLPGDPCAPPPDLVGHVVILLDDPRQREQLPLFLRALALLTDRQVVVVCSSPPDSWLHRLREDLNPAPPAPLDRAASSASPVISEAASVRFTASAGPLPRATVPKKSSRVESALTRVAAPAPFVYAVEGNALTLESYERCRADFASRIVIFASSRSAQSLGPQSGGTGGGADLFDEKGAMAGEDLADRRLDSATASLSTDVRGCLITLLLESWLVNRKPALLPCITTELQSEASFRMLGPVPVPRRAQKAAKSSTRPKLFGPQTPQVPSSVAPRRASALPRDPATPAPESIAAPEPPSMQQQTQTHNNSPIASPSRLAPRTSFLVLTLGGLWPLKPVEEGAGDGDEGPDSGGWVPEAAPADEDEATSRHGTPHAPSEAVDGARSPDAETIGPSSSPIADATTSFVDVAPPSTSMLHDAGGSGSGGAGTSAAVALEAGVAVAVLASSTGNSPVTASAGGGGSLNSAVAGQAVGALQIQGLRAATSKRLQPLTNSPDAPVSRAAGEVSSHGHGFASDADEHWGDALGFKWCPRFAAGRLIPDTFVNKLLVQGYFNPSLLRLAHMFALGDQVQVQRMRLPSGSLKLTELLCKCPHHTSGAAVPAATTAAVPPLAGQQQRAAAPPPVPPMPRGPARQCECCCDAGNAKGVPWPAVFLHVVVSHRVVPLAVYRDRADVPAPGEKAQHHLPFVHTNPRLGGRVHAGDRLFVVVPQDADA